MRRQDASDISGSLRVLTPPYDGRIDHCVAPGRSYKLSKEEHETRTSAGTARYGGDLDPDFCEPVPP